MMKLLPTLLTLAAFTAMLPLRSEPEYLRQGPDIYDQTADGSAQIAAALTQAKAGGKRVLLDFGANWCPWCHKLHQTFATDPAVSRQLAAHYVVVMVDVNTRKGEARNAAVNVRYGNPVQHGLPVLVVLDADGKKLTTQDTGAFEVNDHHDPAKVLAFLERWAPAGQ